MDLTRRRLFGLTLAASATATLLGELAWAPAASAFGPDVLYPGALPPSDVPQKYGCLYPKTVCLQYQSNTSLNGSLPVTFEQPADLPVFPIYRSTNNGQSWTQIGSVADTANGIGNRCCAFLYALPQAIGSMAAGTILCAGISAPVSDSETLLELYKSTNGGSNWTWVSEIAAGGSYSTTAIWEPNLIVANDTLICYYSDSRDSAHSQKIVHQTSTDGVTWSAAVDDVALSPETLRPGMPVVSLLANGDYFMSYEVVNEASDTPTYFKISSNPESWTPTNNRAALRVLTQKAALGLLDPDWKPGRYQTAPTALPGVSETEPRFDSWRNQDIARRLAEESVVLLDNPEGLLPLAAPRSIAVIGPGADDAHCLFGCCSFPNHVLPHHPDLPLGIAAQTVLDAVRYEPGCAIIGQDRDGFAAAVEAEREVEWTVPVVGDRSGIFGHGTSGEGCDVATLELPGVQGELAEAVSAAARRTILVVVSGRPYAIGRHAARAAATIQAFFPGQEGAAAITGVLSGRVGPSGRLPVQIPGDAARRPGTYLAPPLALKSDGVSNIDPTPAYPFGHGLTYTTFALADVQPSTAAIPVDGSVAIRATLTNTGTRTGVAVPQLYLSDPVATVTRPVRRLIGFARVEPGRVVLTVAQSAADPGLSAHVVLEGEVRIVDHTRTMRTPATVRGKAG